MVSVVIAAHNEARVIGRTLAALRAGTTVPLEVIVVPNGCTDVTAAAARGVDGCTVVEVTEGGKANALNVGDAVATGFPRIYLDADIVVPTGGIDALVAALSDPVKVAVPGRRLVLDQRPVLVRAYYAINERLPAYRDGLFGRGLVALSADGRSRFDTFPLMVADDLFLDSLFTPAEKAHLPQVAVLVETPSTTRELLARLTRVRRGNAAMRAVGRDGGTPTSIRPAARWSWLTDVVLPQPWLAPAGIVYAALTLIAAARARRGPLMSTNWGRPADGRRD